MKGDQAESQEIYETVNRLANVQGVRRFPESREGIRLADTLKGDRSADTPKESRSTDIHSVSIVHNDDDVHNMNSIMIRTIEVKINEV